MAPAFGNTILVNYLTDQYDFSLYSCLTCS